MGKYRVKVRYVFTGYYDIEASNEIEAKEIATNDCGLVRDSIQTTNEQQVVDWDYPQHPEKHICMVIKLK